MRHYTCTYLSAVRGQIDYSPYEGDRITRRATIARALQECRAIDRDWAQRERYHIKQIAGCFPVKVDPFNT